MEPDANAQKISDGLRKAAQELMEATWNDGGGTRDALAGISIGDMRAKLEQRLGLEIGGLDSRAEEVKTILQSEIRSLLKAKEIDGPAKKKHKKDKKEKKEAKLKEEEEARLKAEEEARRKAAEQARLKAEEARRKAEEEARLKAARLKAEEEAKRKAAEEARLKAEEDKRKAEQAKADAIAKQLALEKARELAIEKARIRVLSGGEDGLIRLWDMAKCVCDRVLEGHVGIISAVDVNSEWTQCISAAEDGAKHWDLRQGTCLRSFTYVSEDKNKRKALESMKTSALQKKATAIGATPEEIDKAVDEENPKAAFIDLILSRPSAEQQDVTTLGCAAVASDWSSTMLGGCGDGKLRLWDLKTGDIQQDVLAHPGGVWALQANWEKKKVASGGDEHFKIWDLEELTCIHKIEGHPGGLMCLSVDWSENKVLVGAGEKSLKLWDLQEGTSKNYVGHRDAVACISASWNGEDSVAVSAGWDAQIRHWMLDKESATGFDCKFGRVRSLAVNFHNMQAVCGSSSGSLHLIDLRSGKEIQSTEGHIGAVSALRMG